MAAHDCTELTPEGDVRSLYCFAMSELPRLWPFAALRDELMTHLTNHLKSSTNARCPHGSSPFRQFAAREAGECVALLFCRVAASVPPGSAVELSTSVRFPAPTRATKTDGVSILDRRIIFDGQRHEWLEQHVLAVKAFFFYE